MVVPLFPLSLSPVPCPLTGGLVREKVTPISNTYEVSKTVLGRGASAEVVIGTHIISRRQYAVKVRVENKKKLIISLLSLLSPPLTMWVLPGH